MGSSVSPLIAIALVAAPVASVAHAQDGAAVDLTGIGIYAMEDSVMAAAGQVVARPAAPQHAVTRLGFRPSAERRRATVEAVLRRLPARDAAARAEVRRLLTDPASFTRLDAALRAVGGRSDDVADAFAGYWIVAWYAAHGRDESPDARTFAAVRRQAAAALVGIPQLARSDDAARQQVADANLIQALLIAATLDGQGQNPAARRAIAGQVRRGAAKAGLDLMAITLTPQGFVPDRR